jgi:hypothetical protein
MKFSYFPYFAKDFFISLPTGERLFRFGTFWTKPYIVRDSETENRLLKKTIILLRVIFWSGLVFNFLVVFDVLPITNLWWVGIYL